VPFQLRSSAAAAERAERDSLVAGNLRRRPLDRDDR
jgi:hypothetical protein